MRAFWKGYLKLALVSCPVGLSPRPRPPTGCECHAHDERRTA